MKKIILCSLLFISLFLTGCSKNKKIECSYYEELLDRKITYDYILTFDKSGKTIKTLEFSLEFSFNEKEELNEFVGNDDVCNKVMDSISSDMVDLVTCSAKSNDNNLIVIMNYNYEEMTNEQKQSLFANMTYDEFKDNYERNNFDQDICKFNSDKKVEPVLYNGGMDDIIGNSFNPTSDNSDTSDENSTNDVSKVMVSSANGILLAAETFAVTYMLDHDGEMITNTIFTCDGNTCSSNINGATEYLDFKGTVPTSGSIYIDSNGEATIKESLVINGFTCTMNNDGVVCSR